MKLSKKLNLLFLTILTAILFFAFVTPTYAKLTGNLTGLLGSISITDKIAAGLIGIPSEGSSDAGSWIDGSFVGNSVHGSPERNEESKLDTLKEKVFSINNQSDKRLLITFKFGVNTSINIGSSFNITVTKDDFSIEVEANGNWFGSYEIEFNPTSYLASGQISQENLEKYFVITPDSNLTHQFMLNVEPEGWDIGEWWGSYSYYVSVQMIAVPYDG